MSGPLASGLSRTNSDALSFAGAAPSSPQLLPEQVLNTPVELCCPITCDIYRDPVINAAGQVYDRHAISEHLTQHSTDPLTRQPLESATLLPVHLLRSRALEYRETAARICIEAACTSGCATDPVRYVRRACELVGEAGDVQVKGLTPGCVSYVLRHVSNAYDAQVLQALARSLFDTGYKDRAAVVYYSLLQAAGVDRSQQADLLRLCLNCWAGSGGDQVMEPDAATLQKLAVFVEGQHAFSWAQILDIVEEAGLGTGFSLKLCELLLFRSSRGGGPQQQLTYSAASSPGSSSTAAAGGGGGPDLQWGQEKELLIRYTKMLCGAMECRVDELARRVEDLSSSPASSSSQGGQRQQHPRQGGEQPKGAGGGLRSRLPPALHWVDLKVAAAALMTVATAASKAHPLLKGAQLVPAVLLLWPGADSGR